MAGQQTQHHLFSVDNRQHGNPHIETGFVVVIKNTAILRQTLFGNIQVRQNLNLIDHRCVVSFLDDMPLDELPVDTETHPANMLVGFEMNVAGIIPVSIIDQIVQETGMSCDKLFRCLSPGFPIAAMNQPAELFRCHRLDNKGVSGQYFQFLHHLRIITAFFSVTNQYLAAKSTGYHPVFPGLSRRKPVQDLRRNTSFSIHTSEKIKQVNNKFLSC